MNKKKHRKRIIRLIILNILLITILLVWGKSIYLSSVNKEPITPSVTPHITDSKGIETIQDEVQNTPLNINTDSLVSKNAILINVDLQKLLLEKNSQDIIYPASMTKIMTVIVALENIKDLSEPITLSQEMFDQLRRDNASLAGFLPNETLRAQDLLYGALLPSGAECCIGLAEYISGSEKAFVELMNNKAEELELNNTHFTNSTGLHSPDHYTTVADLAVLLEYSIQSKTFRDIFTSQKYSTQPSNLHPDGITFYSTMFKNLTSPELSNGTILGGKTGYTSQAGLCLASLADIDGSEYILVTAGADGNHSTEQYNIKDAVYTYSNLTP